LPVERFDISTAMKVQVDVFWIMTACSVVVGYQRSGGQCLHHHPEMEADKSCEILSDEQVKENFGLRLTVKMRRYDDILEIKPNTF
jgi:hypothetical protein